MMQLTIDGRSVTLDAPMNLLEAARTVGIEIPNLCYDPALSTFSGCRLCLVEIEGERKLHAACSTDARDGMVVRTKTPEIIELRRDMLDLLISNHPLDCLTCEKGGHCKLQDLCRAYGVKSPSYMREAPLPILDAANPIMIRDQSKCIKCGKCVRVCREIQGTATYDHVGRGFTSTVTTANDRPISREICRMCGQCVEMCPTGALINKQFIGYKPWELKKVRTTCPFCGTGCNFYLNVDETTDRVVGVTPCPEAPINGTELCVKGRFHSDFIHSEDRLTTPLIRKDGELVPASWEEAYRYAATRLTEIRDTYGPDAVAGLSSARCTNEENYLFQKFMRAAIGTNNVDHCART
jgi:NADH-quinone oxidoreductase subunit G